MKLFNVLREPKKIRETEEAHLEFERQAMKLFNTYNDDIRKNNDKNKKEAKKCKTSGKQQRKG